MPYNIDINIVLLMFAYLKENDPVCHLRQSRISKNLHEIDCNNNFNCINLFLTISRETHASIFSNVCENCCKNLLRIN